jgi:hypothetical protein
MPPALAFQLPHSAWCLQGHNFIAQVDGTYSFCLDNKMSRWTAKIIDFDLVVTGESHFGPM